jgi:hypothetical protein
MKKGIGELGTGKKEIRYKLNPREMNPLERPKMPYSRGGRVGAGGRQASEDVFNGGR